MFSITYKQKNSAFHKLFPTIDKSEKLLIDYSCALQKEILIQGKLYISQNFVCFHANIFGWETALQIPVSKIKNIRKSTTVKFIPNAIILELREDDDLLLNNVKKLANNSGSQNQNLNPVTDRDSNFTNPAGTAQNSSNPSNSNLLDVNSGPVVNTDLPSPNVHDENTIKFTSFLDRNAPFNVIYNLLKVYNSTVLNQTHSLALPQIQPESLEENSVLWSLVLKRYHSASDLTELLEKQGWKKPERSQSLTKLNKKDSTMQNSSDVETQDQTSSDNLYTAKNQSVDNLHAMPDANAQPGKIRHKSSISMICPTVAGTNSNHTFMSVNSQAMKRDAADTLSDTDSDSESFTSETETDLEDQAPQALKSMKANLIAASNQSLPRTPSGNPATAIELNQAKSPIDVSPLSPKDNDFEFLPKLKIEEVIDQKKTLKNNKITSKIDNFQNLIQTVPIFNHKQFSNIEIEKIFKYDLATVYKNIYDETSEFQLAYMNKVSKNFISSSGFTAVENEDDNKLESELVLDNLGQFQNIKLKKTSKVNDRKFTQQISTPLLNKLVNNNENMRVSTTKLKFNYFPEKHQLAGLSNELETKILSSGLQLEQEIMEVCQTSNTPNVPYGASFNVVIRTCLIPHKINFVIQPKLDGDFEVASTVIETRLTVSFKIDFMHRCCESHKNSKKPRTGGFLVFRAGS